MKFPFFSLKLRLNQNGFSLMELVIAIILIGVTLPALLSLYANLSAKASDSAVMDQLVALTQRKMEEIVGFKENAWDWYLDPTQFEDSESLPDNYQRTVTVQTVSNWGNASLDGWDVIVSVTHPRLTSGYQLSVRFTKYHE